MTKYFTETGDDGYTGRLGKGRLAKHDRLIEAIGTIDEASAAIGLARASSKIQGNKDLLVGVQRDLYHLMAELSATSENASKFRVIDEDKVRGLESQIEAIGSDIVMPSEFIVPGDNLPGAAMSLARSIVRRAERRVSELLHAGEIENQQILPYLNRLSSLCFVLELLENNSTNISLAKKDS
ncbi:MAG: cob(I)yrinic acid a,c-diamide adenosyltransferase [Chloroflexota bacterium]|nr:MAG: cob(I)yrinic acid a,c-diamide adenosyltransferase [Chloroflexota bacterium]